MKKLLFAIMLFCSSLASADEATEAKLAQDKEFCGYVSELYIAGAWSQSDGVAREVKDLTEDLAELLQHHEPLPKDGMYLYKLAEYSEDELGFIQWHLYHGWDDMANKPADYEGDRFDMANMYFKGCMEEKAKQ